MTTPIQVAIPTIRDLKDNAARQLQQALTDASVSADNALSVADIKLARSNLDAMAFVQGVGIHGAYRYLKDFIARQAIPTKAVEEYLDGWLEAYGIPRKEARVGTGVALGTGEPGYLVLAGTEMQDEDGLLFTVLEDTPVSGALRTVNPRIVCSTPGAAGNLAAGTVLELVTTVPGIDRQFTVSPAGISGGVDRENDSEAVYRLNQRLANPPRGSAPSDYERWALSVPGITRAWGIRNPSGPTSAGVIIMADNNQYGLPTQAQRAEVFAYIRDPDRGPPDELFVIIPEPVFVDPQLSLTPDSQAVRDAVTLELKDLFFREAVPHGRIPHTHLSEAVSAASGETDHIFLQPMLQPGGFLTAGAFQILVLRNISYVAA